MPVPLLLTDRVESCVLQPAHFRLQESQVHRRRSTVVLTLGVRHARTLDPEEGHTAAIRAPDLD
jgi:hypothetical protein